MSFLNTHARRILTQNTRGNNVNLNLFFRSISVQCNSSISSLHQNNQFNQQSNHLIFNMNRDNTSLSNQTLRMMSTKPPPEEEKEQPSEEATKAANDETPEEEAKMEEKELTKEEQLEAEIKKLKDALLRSLAEQENTRRIAKRDVESARQYAITSFAKTLLDAHDNLSRAMDSVPPNLLEPQPEDEVSKTLTTLYEGIKMTEDGLLKAFQKNGLKRYAVVGDAFDPNLHNALYEYPDKEKDAGTIGAVIKKGFSLHGRTIRPAEVGVVKKE